MKFQSTDNANMTIRTLHRIILIAVAQIALTGLSGCTGGSALTYQNWLDHEEPPTFPFTTNKIKHVEVSWSRIGPKESYDAWIRSNVIEGRIEFYGYQTCYGQYARDDGMYPANGRWVIICADDSFASGNFQINDQGGISATGADTKGEWVTFDLAPTH
ncbi:hypothetical protein COO92_03085 [Thalassospira lohafexi]|uniref:Uncharacterized protein n=1 Tax=Thalassospira lohafexi TaxID=744227 RepID=A0A2N3LC13_9PROT|nr:hypothetical protein COO92_03085 [Thalassospira lohafexi]